MTNSYQIPLEDQAKAIIEWMDKWEIDNEVWIKSIDDPILVINGDEHWVVHYKMLLIDLDVIRHVEQALEQRKGVDWVQENYMEWVKYYSSSSESYWTTAKDKLRAVYKSLKEEGEV